MKIIVPIGISGSGKSKLYLDEFKDKGYILVCPDNIRKKLTGDISDQSKNKEVFEYANTLIDIYIRYNVNVYFDATNLNKKLRKKFVNKYKDNPNVEIHYYILPADIKLSNERIQKNLSNNIDRSKVPYDVLERQIKMYNDTIKKGFGDENVHKVIMIK
ncbi:MAG: ATP-binding protein [Lachnospiraceae bacterium]|nr:ATP-binding protein [Lachnospiraceae bacterium]